jgi:hypothetical protein
LFPDLGGLSGDAGSSADATTDVNVPDTNVTDTSADVSTSDGGGGADADADAATTGWCATHPGHTFCEDFDEPNFQARWTGTTVPTDASVVESDASSVSPPNELLVTVPVPASASPADAYTYKHFATAKTAKIQLQLMANWTGLATLDPVVVELNPPPSGYKHYDIHVDVADDHLGNNYTPNDGGANVNTDTTFTNPFQAWHNLEIDLDLTKSTVQLFVDGVSAASWTIAPTSPTGFDLRVGSIGVQNGTTTATTAIVQVDDVLVDTN